jgi:hypothetical protein
VSAIFLNHSELACREPAAKQVAVEGLSLFEAIFRIQLSEKAMMQTPARFRRLPETLLTKLT